LLDLDYIEFHPGSRLAIGAQTSLQSIAQSPLLQQYANGLLAEAAYASAALGLRNAAVLGGALAESDGPPELVLALLAAGAEVILRTAMEVGHTLTLDNYLATRRAGDRTGILVEVLLPAGETYGALQRVARTPHDQAIVAAAAVADSSGRLRLALSSWSQERLLLEAAPPGRTPEALAGLANQARQSCRPQGDYRGSAEYRSEMAAVLARRAAAAAWQAQSGA
ncbi:MAG: hypothetical protein GYA17_10295, partial [Chloroflexi bacterium]|nr:hypothetical protein [Chloroflexota bacterium]